MKKNIKRLAFAFLIVVLLMGTAFGASYQETISVWFNSITLTVDGSPVEAKNILYDGTTYVPLRAAAEILGKDVDWDAKTRTANIRGVDTTEGVYSKADMDKLKLYIRIEDRYMSLVSQDNSLLKIGEQLEMAQYLIKNHKDSSMLKPLSFYIDDIAISIENGVGGNKEIILEAGAYGLDISNMKVTEKDNVVALSYYKKAFDSLERYSINGSKKELENYLEYYDKAQTSVYQHDNVNWLGAHIYYTKIKEY